MGVGKVYEIEPNNTASTANSISLGSSATGQLSSSSDVDYYAVNITSAGILTTNFTAPTGNYSSYTINVYNGSGTLLSSWSTSKSDSYQLGVALTGTYYVAVTGAYNTGQYSVALSATSSTPDKPPSATYAVYAGSSSVNEGSTATFTLTTTNVTAGTVVPYTISGVTSADIVGGALSGNATVGANGQATITVALAADNLTEGSETLTVTAGGASASTLVNDTTLNPVTSYKANIYSLNPLQNEGFSSTTKFNFSIELDKPVLEKQSIFYSVTSNEATGNDFTAGVLPSGLLTFEVGEKLKIFSIEVAGDTLVEPNEIFQVNLSQVNKQLELGDKSSASATIINDDISNKSNFDIVINYTGDTKYKIYFDQAEQLFEQIILGDVPDIRLPNGTLVDDIVINAKIGVIDGVGKTLGQAGPTYYRSGSYLPCEGQMTFDVADMSGMISLGTFADVVVHEMMHVLGFGTIWPYLGLNKTFGQYTGTNALNEYRQLTNDPSKKYVPLETGGTAGTANVHWSESAFTTEIMTGYANNTNMPITRMTIASLVDLGYVVDLTRAELFVPRQHLCPRFSVVI